MADVSKENGNGDWHAKDYEEEDDDEDWEYETEDEDEVVDRKLSLGEVAIDEEEDDEEEEEEIPPPPITPQETAEKKKKTEKEDAAAAAAPDANGKDKDDAPEAEEGKNGHIHGEEDAGKKHRHHHRHGGGSGGGGGHHHKKHKKSRHLERLEAFSKSKEGGGEQGGEPRKRIHVRSKDPSRIARQLEKSLNSEDKRHHRDHHGKGHGAKGRPAPPQQKVNTVCKVCGKEPYVVERVVAEKSWWHKNCFRCKQCNKTLNLDTYMSHEGVIYCKPHHKELFQPKVVKDDIIDVSGSAAAATAASFTQSAIARHKEQERRMETIVRENRPVDLGDRVVKSSVDAEEAKYQGLENLDVGSKFKMFENAAREDDDDCDIGRPSSSSVSTDRYGIMEKLRRLQEGEDLGELLAEIDEEIPSESGSEADPTDVVGMTAVQRKTHKAEKMFGEGGQVERRDKLAEERRKELKSLREKLMAGTRDSVLDQFSDLLNASANKIKKTRVDVKSDNAKRFKEMFDQGQVPEGAGVSAADRITWEKDQELEQMRKSKREQKDFFKKLESGELDEAQGPKEPKLLVGKIKTRTTSDVVGVPEDMPEMASLSNRFSFFENYSEEEQKKKKKKGRFRISPPRDGAHPEEFEEEEDAEAASGAGGRKGLFTEADLARKECKARSVLNKFKEMENKVLNGEDDVKPSQDPDKPVMTALGFLGKLPGVSDRRPLKRFTPPRDDRSGTDDYSSYSDEYSDSESYTSSYTESDYDSEDDDEDGGDETLRAIRATARAKALRAKFEEWESSQDAREQMRQMALTDENGASLETASNLKARFEALNARDEGEGGDGEAERPKFRPKRFK